MHKNDKKYSSSILTGTLTAASVTVVLLMTLKHAHAFGNSPSVIDKMVELSANHSEFFVYAIFILIVLILAVCTFGMDYAKKVFNGQLLVG